MSTTEVELEGIPCPIKYDPLIQNQVEDEVELVSLWWQTEHLSPLLVEFLSKFSVFSICVAEKAHNLLLSRMLQ